jgi:hypothetical protein
MREAGEGKEQGEPECSYRRAQLATDALWII